MALPNIQIIPGPQAGSATSTDYKQMVQSDSYGYFDYKFGKLSAVANPGWTFDHWEWEQKMIVYWYGPDDPNPETYETQYTSTSNTFDSQYFVWTGNSPPYDTLPGTDNKPLRYGEARWKKLPFYDYPLQYHSVTYIKAIFKAPGTGKILYNPNNNKILHGKNGTIIYDD